VEGAVGRAATVVGLLVVVLVDWLAFLEPGLPYHSLEIAAVIAPPMKMTSNAKPSCPATGQALERCQNDRADSTICYAERQRGCVYGLPLAEWSEQIIGVPAEVTPVAPTGEQNAPGCTMF
jgi:hypothetical protein